MKHLSLTVALGTLAVLAAVNWWLYASMLS